MADTLFKDTFYMLFIMLFALSGLYDFMMTDAWFASRISAIPNSTDLDSNALVSLSGTISGTDANTESIDVQRRDDPAQGILGTVGGMVEIWGMIPIIGSGWINFLNSMLVPIGLSQIAIMIQGIIMAIQVIAMVYILGDLLSIVWSFVGRG